MGLLQRARRGWPPPAQAPPGARGQVRRATGGRWGDNLRRISVLVAVGDPIVQGTTGAIDDAWSRGMSGRSGTKRIGDSATAEFRWLGYMPYQRLNAIPVGATPSIRRNPNIALPNTHGDVRTVGATLPVAALLRNMSTARRR